MMPFARKFARLLDSEDGSTAVHLAVVSALIAILCLAAVSSLHGAVM